MMRFYSWCAGGLWKAASRWGDAVCVFKSLLSILYGQWVVGSRKEMGEGQKNTAVVHAEGDGHII